MDDEEVGRLWDANAEAWTALTRAGFDTYRDQLNTPAFLALLPPVDGLTGLDVGCGEGHNTRLIAERGAHMTAVDVSPRFVRFAREEEAKRGQGINYREASANQLPFADGSFDFAIATMSLMDVADTAGALAEVYRVLRPGGFLQFSISHPCFDTPYRQNLRGQDNLTYAIAVGDYFRNQQGDISEWTFSSADEATASRYERFRVPRFTRTLSQWINMLLDAGFGIERLAEPQPSAQDVANHPNLQDASVVAYFLHVRVRKPAAPGD